MPFHRKIGLFYTQIEEDEDDEGDDDEDDEGDDDEDEEKKNAWTLYH